MSGEKGDRLPSGKGRLDEAVNRWNNAAQTAGNRGTGRLAFLLHQLFDMPWIINPGMAVITARMAGNLAHPVKQANPILTGNQRQLLSNRLGWNGVVIQIVPDIDRLIRPDRCHKVGLKIMLWKREQRRPLLVDHLADQPGIVLAPATLIGCLRNPKPCLTVQILD